MPLRHRVFGLAFAAACLGVAVAEASRPTPWWVRLALFGGMVTILACRISTWWEAAWLAAIARLPWPAGTAAPVSVPLEAIPTEVQVWAEGLSQRLQPVIQAYAEQHLQIHQQLWTQERDRLRSEVRMAQAESRQYQQQFYELIHRLEGVFGLWDTATQKWLYLSAHSENLWGLSREVLLRDLHGWLTAVHPDDRARVAQALRDPTYPLTLEYRVLPEKWVRDRWFAVRDEAGQVDRVLRLAEDISDRPRVERLKGEFISIVSHELRTPLTSIRGSLGLLASGLLADRPERAQRMLAIASAEVERLVRLVNDILDIERLELDKISIEKTWCDAGKLLSQAVDIIYPLAVEAGVNLLVFPVAVMIWADGDRIVQTLTNLLSNAVKFSEAGSKVTASVRSTANEAIFQVSDRGRGIPPDKLEVIFGKFQQVDATDSRRRGGTGLGLAICRKIVEIHGGRIWVESTLGQGSTFYVALPLQPACSLP